MSVDDLIAIRITNMAYSDVGTRRALGLVMLAVHPAVGHVAEFPGLLDEVPGILRGEVVAVQLEASRRVLIVGRRLETARGETSSPSSR